MHKDMLHDLFNGGREPQPRISVEDDQPPADAGGGAAPDAPAAEPPVAAGPPSVTIPVSAMAKLKKEAAERGAKQVREQLDADAKALGFADHKDMIEKFKAARSSDVPPDEPAAPADDEEPAHPRTANRMQREITGLKEQVRQLTRRVAHEQRLARTVQSKMDAVETEGDLKVAAARAGVADVDYAIALARKEMVGLDDEALAAFDPHEFFEKKLREKAPYLFQVERRPANTAAPAPAGARPAAPPTPAQVTEKSGETKVVDASAMPRDEFQKLLRERGLLDPAVMS